MILDDYSRYIIAWLLTSTMSADDVKNTLDLAVTKTGITGVRVKHRPRMLDNEPCYVVGYLKRDLDEQGSAIPGVSPTTP